MNQFKLIFASVTLLAGSHSAVAADIVDTAIAAGSFKTLVQAVQAAGLLDVLKAKGPFTVSAPNDDAFATLPAGTLEALLKDKEKLQAVLTYHVVAAKVMAADVKTGPAKTVQGKSVSLKSGGGGVTVDAARVVMADIVTDNGVIHVIDSVIIPN